MPLRKCYVTHRRSCYEIECSVGDKSSLAGRPWLGRLAKSTFLCQSPQRPPPLHHMPSERLSLALLHRCSSPLDNDIKKMPWGPALGLSWFTFARNRDAAPRAAACHGRVKLPLLLSSPSAVYLSLLHLIVFFTCSCN